MSSQPAGGALTGQWGLCVLLACRGRPNGTVGSLCSPSLQRAPLYLLGLLPACRGCPNGTVGSLCPPSLQGAPLYLCGVLPGCRGCSDACLWGSSWPAGGALMGGWGLLCPPGLQGAPLYLLGVLLACRRRSVFSMQFCQPAGGAFMPVCGVLPACRGRPNGGWAPSWSLRDPR